eukprot:GHVS01034166.1.p1 GENE.GHVS01034166.1~~GHVS01034166.1.p1  ORF type:complete len:116 (+),score=7.81 GHVS01034166.1:505-852(+)
MHCSCSGARHQQDVIYNMSHALSLFTPPVSICSPLPLLGLRSLASPSPTSTSSASSSSFPSFFSSSSSTTFFCWVVIRFGVTNTNGPKQVDAKYTGDSYFHTATTKNCRRSIRHV